MFGTTIMGKVAVLALGVFASARVARAVARTLRHPVEFVRQVLR